MFQPCPLQKEVSSGSQNLSILYIADNYIYISLNCNFTLGDFVLKLFDNLNTAFGEQSSEL